MVVFVHKDCGGLAIDTQADPNNPFRIQLPHYPFICLTCLEEILEESELRLSEEIRM
jgi:hypothetical protein